MSRSSIQSLTILAVATGAIKTIIIANIGGEAAPTIAYLEDKSQDVINRWPESGSPKKNLKKVTGHIHNIKDDLDSAAEVFSACCLGMLAQELLVLLYERINDTVKLKLIEELLESVDNAVDIYDPNEQQGGSRAEAERLCELVKKEIEW